MSIVLIICKTLSLGMLVLLCVLLVAMIMIGVTEQKFYDLDVKVTEIQTAVEQLQEEAEEKKGKSTTYAFARVPRGQRSAVVPVTDTRATASAPAATTPVPPPAATPPAPATSSEAFVLGVLLTPPPEDQA